MPTISPYKIWKVFRAYAVTPFNQNIFQNERSAPTQQTQDFYETQPANFSDSAIEQRAFLKHFPKARNSWRCDAVCKAYGRACLHTVYGFETSLGEGADIEGLHYIIDIEAFRSAILSEQVPGRLRNLNDGHKFNYFKIANVGFKRVASQLSECSRTWKKNFGAIQFREGIAKAKE